MKYVIHLLSLLCIVLVATLCTVLHIQGTASEVSERIIELTSAHVTDMVPLLGRRYCTFSSAGTIAIGQNPNDTGERLSLVYYHHTGTDLVLTDANQSNRNEHNELVARLSQSHLRVYYPDRPYPLLYSATNTLTIDPNMLSIESNNHYYTRPYVDLLVPLAEGSQYAFADIAGRSVVAYYNPAQTIDEFISVNIIDIRNKTCITRRYKGNGTIINLTFAPTNNTACRDLAILFTNPTALQLFRARCFYDHEGNLRSCSRRTNIAQNCHPMLARNIPLPSRIGYTPDGSRLCIVQCCLVGTLSEFYVVSLYNAHNSKRIANRYTLQSSTARQFFTAASLSPNASQLLIDGLLIDLPQLQN